MSMFASGLVRLARRAAPPERAGWGAAMQAELAAVPAGAVRLRFAAGCLAAAVGQRLRVRAVPVAVRTLGLGVVAVSVVQAGIESDQWLNGNEASRRGYLAVVAAVLALTLVATLRLTARGAGISGIALLAGAALGAAAAGLWAATALLSSRMPSGSLGILCLVAVAACAAGGLVALRTGDARQGWIAALLAALAGTLLSFAAAELLIQQFPAHIPDLVGPVMPSGATPADVLRESRIEILDHYMVLLLLGALLSGAAIVASYAGRPAGTDVPPGRVPAASVG